MEETEGAGNELLGPVDAINEAAGPSPVRNETELRRVPVEWNNTTTDYPRDCTIHELFEAQAARTPEAIAVIFQDQRLTYAELNAQANQLAHYLRRLGVRQDMPVGICHERAPEMIVGLLAILKAGGAYVPLDPTYPPERLDFMLVDSGVEVVLIGQSMETGLAEQGAKVISLNRDGMAIWQESVENLPAASSGESLAYIMYTSGSTGRPKGVCVPHRAVLRLVCDPGYASFSAAEVFLQFAPLAFDASTFEIWGCLLHGARLVVVPPGMPSLEELGLALQSYGVTTLFLTTALFHEIVENRLDCLRGIRQLLTGGEVLSPQHARKAIQELTGCAIANVYGPTENTTFSCYYPMPSATDLPAPVPIGRPIANTQCYVLDKDLQPVPVGLPGELCLGGDGLARGYLKRAELTGEKFVPHPFSDDPGARLYRTGDQVRWRPDGNLEFLGRLDDQVKLRGFRIELGEIEAALCENAGVAQSAVAVREGRAGDRRLVGYVVPRDPESLSQAEIISHLRGKLPAYMVPSAIIPLERLPLTPNGKIDRRALPEPVQDRPQLGIEHAAPQSALEVQLSAIWAEVLGRQDVGIHDNFFDLGGNSLLAMRLQARIGSLLGDTLPLGRLFALPSIAALAAEIESRRGQPQEPQLVVRKRAIDPARPLPLSYSQLRFWLHEQIQPQTTAYRMPLVFRLRGSLDFSALQAGLQQLEARHPILRTRFRTECGEPQQVVGPLPTGGPLGVACDLSAIPAEQREDEAIRRATAEIQRPFDMERGPAWYARLYRLSDSEHWLMLTFHHGVADEWSLNVLLRELAEMYGALVNRQTVDLRESPLHYADYVKWQREWIEGPQAQREREYWRQQLAGAPWHMELPADSMRPAKLSSRGDVCTAVADAALARSLRALSRAEDATLFMTLLAAFQTLLFRYNGQEDFLVGVPGAGRSQPELEGLVGCFLNLLPLRADLSGQPSFRTLLRRVRTTALSAYEHQTLPLEAHLEGTPSEHTPGFAPFQVLFNHLNFADMHFVLPGVSAEFVRLPHGGVNADLELYAAEKSDGIELQLAYRDDLFRRETAERLLEQMQTLLAGIASRPDDPVTRLPLLTAARQEERRADYRRRMPSHSFSEFSPAEVEGSIPARIERQVQRDPDRPAVQTSRHRWTYGQLNATANRIAHTLVAARGFGPEQVALLLGHDAPMIAATLGVLKAGKTYVPLVPSHPRTRLAAALADAESRVLITDDFHRALGDELSPAGNLIINLDEIGTDTAAENLDLAISPDTPAYLLYTSGSTGIPKGVVQNHRNVLHLMRVYTNNLHVDKRDRLTLFSSYGYGAAVMDIFAALFNGAALYPLDVSQTSAQSALQTLRKESVTVFHSTPTLYRYLIGSLGPGELLPTVRLVVLGGEETCRRDFELLQQHFSSECVLVNGLGSTESALSLQNFLRHDTPLNSSSLPVGYPVEGMEICLLDEQGRENDFCGEVAIRSRYVALGYWRRPELTRERFLPDPDGGYRRIFRTGDRARRLPDGMLECLGRRDAQVKLRGHRIDLTEIEMALTRQHPQIVEAAVALCDDPRGEKHLVAYTVFRDGCAVPSGELRACLRETLPDYMVPSFYVTLDCLPMTPNGKIDRRSLPPIEREHLPRKAEYIAPRTPTEETLAGIWMEIFGIDRVGVRDNFFDMGGHSLSVVRLLARVGEATGCNVPLAAFFGSPTIEELALLISPSDAARELVWPLAKGERIPVVAVGDAKVAGILQECLPSNHPLHWCSLPSEDGSRFQHGSVPELAADYCSRLSASGLNDYVLVGFSLGGLLAYEMACHLQQLGRSTPLLFLIEPSAIVERGFATDRLTPASWTRKVVRRLRLRWLETRAWMGLQVPPNWRWFYILENFRRLALDYVPKPFSGRTVIVFGTEYPLEDLAAWRALCSGMFSSYPLNCPAHLTFREDPVVWKEWNALLAKELNRIDAELEG
jgi:amino acid adenylation domain-containing protein